MTYAQKYITEHGFSHVEIYVDDFIASYKRRLHRISALERRYGEDAAESVRRVRAWIYYDFVSIIISNAENGVDDSALLDAIKAAGLPFPKNPDLQ